MYYSAIGLLAALILVIENQDIFLNNRENFGKPAWEVYRRFLFAVLAYYITDILWGILEARKLSVLLFADTTVYFIATAVGVLFWAQFTVAYLDEKNGFGQILIYVGRLIAGAITVLSFVNIFRPVLFTVDGDCVYRALPARYVMLTVQILFLLTITICAFTSMYQNPAEKRQRYRALAFFGLIMAVFLLAQLCFPFLPLYAIAYLLGTCELHTFVIEEEKEEYRRGLQEAKKIAELKQTISSLLDNMPGMTFTKDAETLAYLACNQSFAEYTHKESPDGVIGLTAAEIFDSKTAARFDEEDRIVLSMDEPYIVFEDVRDAVGNRRQFQTTKLKYTDSQGRQCVLGISQDMTDMVRIQRENATTKEAYEKARSVGIIYTHIAQALARGYTDLYYVNLDTEEFVEYRTGENSGSLTEKRRGWHFFEECQIEAEQYVHPDDREAFKKAMERKTLEAALDRDGVFAITYRSLEESGPIYVSMRVSRMEDDDRTIILGVTDVDELMKQRHAAERMKEEQIAYARLSALTGDFLCVYVVDPETDRYREFSASNGYELLGEAKEGGDFFSAVREAALRVSHPEDVNRFLSTFTKENVMAEIERHGIFTLSYRVMMEGKPLYVQLKAAMVEETNGPRLVVGINDIDSQVRQEEEYVENLAQAQREATIDALTGVKNRHAYRLAEERLNLQIAENRAQEFAIVILDVNDLKKVNDSEGHKAGDQYILDACRIICNTFKHSPVFRIGGDEFTVIAQGSDYACIEELVDRVNEQNAEAQLAGGVVIACGMAKHGNEDRVAPVFERADQNMYENKNRLKTK